MVVGFSLPRLTRQPTCHLQVTLTATNGVLTLASTTGLTFSVGDGTADGAMAFTGTLTSINAALDGLLFVPALHFVGVATVALELNDQGNSGSGGAKTAQGSVNISVTNSPPTAVIPDVFVQEDAPDTHLQVDLLASDAEEDVENLTFALLGNSNPTLFDDVQFTGTNGMLLLKHAKDAYDSATLTVRITDSLGEFVDVAFDVHVSAVNDAPVVAINTGLQSGAPAPAAIAPTHLRLHDVDNAASQIAMTIIDPPTRGALMLNGLALAAGESFTQADVDEGRLSYVPASSGRVSDAFTFTASDGAGGTIGPVAFAINLEVNLPDDPVVPPPPPLPPPPPPPVAVLEIIPPPPLPTTPTTPPRGDDDTEILPPTPRLFASPSGGASSPAPAASEPPVPIPPPPAEVAPPVEEKPEPVAVETARLEPIAAPAPAAPAAPAPPEEITAAVAPATVEPGMRVALAPEELKAAAAQVAFVSDPQTPLAGELDALREEVSSEMRTIRLVAGSASFISVGLSIIYFMWTIRGGYLLASLLSTMPAWKLVDPLPILDHFDDKSRSRRNAEEDDEETLESLAAGQRSMT